MQESSREDSQQIQQRTPNHQQEPLVPSLLETRAEQILQLKAGHGQVDSAE